MAWTQEDIDELKRAMASGARKVQFKDRIEEFRSIAEMERLLHLMKKEVNRSRRKVVYPEIDRDL